MEFPAFSALRGAGIASVLALVPLSAFAGGVMDGRTGPTAFTGPDLDFAMVALNDFLQAHYARDDRTAAFDAAPRAGFRRIAVAVSAAPFDRAEPELAAFGWAVTDGASLDLHLAAFSAEVLGRGEDLFVRIARAEAAKSPDFATVASDVQTGPTAFGRVRDDPTLDGEMAALTAGLRAFEAREAEISRAVPQVTGASFDAYAEALRLF